MDASGLLGACRDGGEGNADQRVYGEYLHVSCGGGVGKKGRVLRGSKGR